MDIPEKNKHNAIMIISVIVIILLVIYAVVYWNKDNNPFDFTENFSYWLDADVDQNYNGYDGLWPYYSNYNWPYYNNFGYGNGYYYGNWPSYRSYRGRSYGDHSYGGRGSYRGGRR